ncbi:uncharacterized protein LOC119326840 [Triticum dicoccoides]|uniref:uncharacterized protein LOC119326840 n=1 Tax=Triticum dicoccoides TaxID=85692 RepID=UPI00188DFBB0|nr:uncharacterized protein LOC119326840 [Triticum dicoccoides]XP_037456323.1 uncharacterized protein LOC119326840 [Triticum dicoccoides]XP_037456324.1 uncharacterized protein LOC119326840 [Triticum dicoccoides]
MSECTSKQKINTDLHGFLFCVKGLIDALYHLILNASQEEPQVVNYKKRVSGAETFIPLVQYVSRLKPVMHIVTPVGEMRGRTYQVVTEEGKRLMASLIRTLHDFHRAGKCPEQFCASDIAVTSTGRVKHTNTSLLRGKTDELVLRNYEDARDIFEKTVFDGYDPTLIPEDIKHLLQLMTSPGAISAEYVISTHASLVPLSNRYQFYLDMCDHITSVLDGNPEQNDILSSLPYGDKWVEKLEGNLLLEESFHRSGPYDTEGSAMAFLKFYRDTLMCRMENFMKPFKSFPGMKPLEYTKGDFESVLLVTYPMCLPRMQEELEKHKQLRDLNLQNLTFI